MDTELKPSIPTRDTLIPSSDNRTMFAAIAVRYDLMNRVISLRMDATWRRRAVQALCPVAGGRYLDIGAGTGDLSLTLAAAAQEIAVVGLDPVAAMMAIGLDKAKRSQRLERIHFIAGDTVNLPFQDKVFNGVVLGFCIRNVENRDQALGEIYRVMKPGSRLAILELTVPTHKLAAILHGIYTRTVVPVAARVLSLTSAYDYLVKSVKAFPPTPEFERQMRRAGFICTSVTPLTFGAVSIFCGTKAMTANL